MQLSNDVLLTHEELLEKALDIIAEMLLAGSHAGECTNVNDILEPCMLHVEAYRKREQKAREFLISFVDAGPPTRLS